MWLLLAFISAITAALVTIFAKMGLEHVDSILATTIRTVIMMIFLLATSLALKKFSGFNIQGKDWIYIFLSGLFGALSWLAYFLALKIGPTTKVAAIDKTSLLFVALLSVLFLKDTLTLKNFIGIIVIIAGIFLVV